MMKRSQYFLYAVVFGAWVGVMIWAHKKNATRHCEQIYTEIRPLDLFFLEHQRVLSAVEYYASRPILGQPTYYLPLHLVSAALEDNAFVRAAHFYRFHNGSLKIFVDQKVPLARVWREGEREVYLSKEGEIFSLSAHHTPRVPVLHIAGRGDMPREWFLGGEWREAWLFISRLSRDSFWRSQIAQIAQRKNGQWILHGQVGDEKIIFGSLSGQEEKLEKLYAFYTQILPSKGWGRYAQVDLRFHNQIVCK